MSAVNVNSLTDKAKVETGPFELEFSYETSGLNKETGAYVKEDGGIAKYLWDKCAKNPGHKDFIPIDEFNLDRLPDGYKEQDIYELVKTLSELTVSISVSYASPARPEKLNDSTYPCFSDETRYLTRCGTGRVWDAVKVENEICPCETCKTSTQPCLTWAKIGILTAMHVIYDESEVKSSKFELGYNKDDKNDDKYHLLEGYKVYKTEVEQDMCYLYSASHCVELVDSLKAHLDDFQERCAAVNKKYSRDSNMKLTAIVSHPHGYFKHVTLGVWVERVLKRNNNTKYKYTTATCPGCSGAPVYVVGRDKGWWLTHHHSGTEPPLNVSGIGWL
ncbi:uncharacterized protein LOC131950809 [Physella acuta]|uniref:uncharacterized protein LOC131950809 n=1 Tax=Physella acuta TaxID=109671 RepID=UPI0027DC78EA|nr:uncharacterized protein LOC131950809 [Physella acuta]